MADLALVLRIGNDKRSYTLSPGSPPIVIGRAPDVTLALKATLLSRRHCELALTEKGLELHDLGSANGTFVNGRRVQGVELQPGDLIQVGDVDIRVEFNMSGSWVTHAAQAGDLRCKKCGKRISMSTVGDDHAFEWGDEIVCSECSEVGGFDVQAVGKLGELLARDG